MNAKDNYKTFKLLLMLGLLLNSTYLLAQESVSGKVISSADGSPLLGTYVIEKASVTNNGTVVDVNGNYKLTLKDKKNAILVFSSMGYKTKEIVVGGKSVINVQLDEDALELDAVIVTGYSKESKKLSTGSYTTINSEVLTEKVTTNFQEGLQGLSPGLDVTSASGSVGGAVNIRIRGTGSLSSNSNPLYVINGIPFTSYPTDGTGNFGTSYNPMTNINPQDIESVTVLKDAEATAIYGSRGANGVIIITTKSGKDGKAVWDINYSEGIATPTNMLEHLGTEDWVNYLEEAWENSSVPEDKRKLPHTDVAEKTWYTEDVAKSIDEDKYEQVYRQARQRNLSLAVSGGNDKVTYRVNGAYAMNEGIIKQNDNDRISFSSNFNVKLNDKMSVSINSNSSNVQNSQYPTNIYFLNVQGQTGGVFRNWSNPTGLNFIRNALPMFPTYNPDGTFFQATGLKNISPALDPEYFYHVSNSFTTINSADFNYQITPNLTLDAKVGVTYTGYERNVWFSPFITTIAEKGDCAECYGYADNMKQARTYINSNAVLKYSKEVDDHSFDALFGVESFTEDTRLVSMKGVGYPRTNSVKSVGNAQEIIEWRANESGVVFYSAFFRGKYAYKQKYLLGASIRADGSSRFGANNRWGIFPSASLGWNVSEEEFLNSSDVLTYLKLRTSYGVSGNAEIDQSAAFANWSFVPESYGNMPGISPLRLNSSTDNIGWERAYSLDIGADFELYNGKIKGELAYFDKVNDNLLAKLDLPPSSGGGKYITNAGTIRNWGYEASLTFKVVDKAFKWSTTLNTSFLRNRVEELIVDSSVLEQADGVAYPKVGGSVASYQMVKWLGVDPQTGHEMFEDPSTGQPYMVREDSDDPNSSLVYPATISKAEMEKLRQPIEGKSGLPRFTGGWSNSLSYKGIGLNFMFSFREGNWIYDDELTLMSYMRTDNKLTNVPQHVYDNRWQNPGDVTDVPKVYYNHPFGVKDPDQGSRSTRFLYDGSFIRLKNISLSYTLPKRFTESMRINNLRVYISGTNLLTFTKYPGWDPEASNSIGNFSPMAANIAPGVIKGNPPQAKTVKIGVNLNF